MATEAQTCAIGILTICIALYAIRSTLYALALRYTLFFLFSTLYAVRYTL